MTFAQRRFGVIAIAVWASTTATTVCRLALGADNNDRRLIREVDVELARVQTISNDAPAQRESLKILLEQIRHADVSSAVRNALERKVISRIPSTHQESDVVPSEPRVRIWRDSTGQYSLAASLKQFHRDATVSLRTDDGSIRRVKLDRLSEADLDYLIASRPSCDGLGPFITRCHATGRLVEMAGGSDDGFRVGHRLTICRQTTRHLEIRGRSFSFGEKRRQIGSAEIVHVDLDRSLLRVTESSEKVRDGDELVEAVETEIEPGS